MCLDKLMRKITDTKIDSDQIKYIIDSIAVKALNRIVRCVVTHAWNMSCVSRI